MTPKFGLCGATEEAMRDFRFAISDFRLRRTIGDSGDKRSRSSNFDNFTFTFHVIKRREHHRERFFFTVFSPSEQCNCLFVSCIDEKLESANSFDGDNLPGRSAAAAFGHASPCEERTIPSSSHNSRCGPHAGQAFGCAWNLRSAGFSYSFRHSGHIENFSSLC